MIYYHNPRCTKSREGLKLLQDKKIELTIKDYLKETLTKEEIKTLISTSEHKISEFIRPKETKDENISATTDDDWINAIANHPRILQRPILTTGTKTAIGRPPEHLLSIL